MGQDQHLVEVELADGQIIWAQIDLPDGPQDAGLLDGGTRMLQGFETTLRSVASNVRHAVKDAAPDKISVEFGVELAVGKEGLVAALAGTSAKAAVKVTLSWDRESADAQAEA